jgi:radical SAM protein with 4Fe4S-binding SPASM domain
MDIKATIGTRRSENRTDLSTVVPLKTPYVIFVDPSSACNFACTFCPTGDHQLIKSIGRFQGSLSLESFSKILQDVNDFPDQVRVLRMYKDGEPLVNRNLETMIKMAKESGKFAMIDTTTNAALLSRKRADSLIASGIDLINISIDGLDAEQFAQFAKAKVNFDEFLDNLRYLYSIRGECKIVIKTTREIIGSDREEEFFATFGNICDRIFVENTSPCWPDFDVEERMGISITAGLYGNEVIEQTACPYLFYSISVNSDMKVSACFVDWSRDLIIGDLKVQSLSEVWNSPEMNAHRFAHLTGRRKEHSTCGSCGQISHCGPDSIEESKDLILQKFSASAAFHDLDETLERVGYRGTINLPIV